MEHTTKNIHRSCLYTHTHRYILYIRVRNIEKHQNAHQIAQTKKRYNFQISRIEVNNENDESEASETVGLESGQTKSR